MAEWLDGMAGAGYTQAIFWTFGALVLLVLVLLVIKLARSMTFGTFVAGGRNRKTRLAVMDATAVDTARRLVLVRRDDVEHLLLIGGPTDVVVERDIKLGQQRRIPASAEAARDVPPPPAPPQPAPTPRQRPAEPPRAAGLPQPRNPAERQQLPQRQADTVAPPRPTLRAEPARPAPRAAPPPAARIEPRTEPRTLPPMPQTAPFSPATRVTQSEDFDDDALLKELEVSLEESSERPAPAPPSRPQTPSLDDEMTKLLGELSTPRRQ